MAIYDKASLVLIPSGTKTSKVYSQKPTNGDGDFTFSRSTAATRVNASGNIEKETQNLITYSNDFSQTAWLKYLLSLTSGQAGYDGTSDAWLIEKSGAYGNVYRNISNSGVYAWSVYAKAGSFDFLALRFRNTSNNYRTAYFDLSNGTLGSVDSNIIKHTIQDVGSGWYRCQIAFNDSAINQVMIYPSDANNGINNSGTGNIYIQDAQLEQGLVARDYIETTTTAIYGGITDNVPRLDYTDSSCPALLLEPQRTNIFTQSEFATLALVSNVNRTNNYGQSPEGVNNSTRLQFTANGFVGNNTQTNGTQYTLSCYAKRNDSGTQDVGFFQDGTGYVNSSWSLTSEWQRFTYTYTAANSSYAGIAGISGADVSVYGFQMEAGSYATSYIPTYGSAVTRNADAPNMQISSLVPNGFFSDTYSIMFDYKDFDRGAGSANLNYLYDTSNQVCMYIYGGTIAIHTPSGEQYISFPEADGKLAFIYDGTNLKIYKNGSQYNSTIAVSTRWENPNFYRLYALNTTSTISYNTFMLFPTALTDQEAIDLTTL